MVCTRLIDSVDLRGRASVRSLLSPLAGALGAWAGLLALCLVSAGATAVRMQAAESAAAAKEAVPRDLEQLQGEDAPTDAPPPRRSPTLELDVVPILTAASCNSGACHGKARGQNGFALSLLGFDPDFDYAAMVNQSRGRRLFPASPRESLLLRKASAEVPHGGGERLDVEGPEYQVLRDWIAAGMPRRADDDPVLSHITLAPEERTMVAGDEESLTVTAHYSDGSTRDVTRLTHFDASESAVASVDEEGRVRAGALAGESTIMARYMNEITTWNTAIPLDGEVPQEVYAALPQKNFIDALVWQKLQKLGITPSEPASDATFLRRAHLDIIGRLPTADEARAFLADPAPNKREELIDSLLDRPEYADFWANKWADLLRPNPYRVGIKATLNLDNWIRDNFRRNVPYDEFVRQLVTAQGSTWHNGAVTVFRDRRDPDEIVTSVSQLFLGIRLECAKCHQHPFEVWGQEDFYSLAAYFAQLGRKGPGLSPPISGGEEMVFHSGKGSVRHPLTGEQLEPRPLFGEAPPLEPGEDPRRALAVWMTSEENHYFAEVAANRIWADLMGRGLVEPVDDLRATNPASNAELLAALGEEFRRQGYDLKEFIRTIATSHVYSLSSLPGERNVADTLNYSRHYRQRLRAEVLLDAVGDITGVPESFAGMPPGSRAMEIWTHRVGSLFLDAFGRPDPNQDPPCERTGETTVVQALHLMNAPELHAKVTHDEGLPSRLAESPRSDEAIVEELYLTVYSRYPDADERALGERVFQQADGNRRQAAEDLLWALLNTPEFVFKD